MTAEDRRTVCQLCNFSPETPGTFVDALIALADYSRKEAGLETFCVFPETAKERRWIAILERERIACGFVPRRRGVVSSIRALLRDRNPVIFHSHFSMYDLGSVFLNLSYRQAKIVWHYHNPTPSDAVQRVKDAVRFALVARMFPVSCIAVGHGVYESLVEAGVPRSRLHLVTNGVSTERFFPSTEGRAQVRKLLSVEDDRTTIFLLLGMDAHRKGVDIFADAVAQLRATSSYDSVFLIVGNEKTREYFSRLKEIRVPADRLRVIEPMDDFPALLSGIDVLVSASRSEGLSYAVAEALAAGKLCICSDIPGVRDIYDRVEGVSLFPSQDAHALAQAMRGAEVLLPGRRRELGAVNREHIVTHQSLDVWARRIVDIYKSF